MNVSRPISSKVRRLPTPAFTLVELLVVIAIVAVLAALLFPALRSMRRSAENTKCISNLRTIGIAIQAYTGDNNGYLPATGFFNPNAYYNRDKRNIQNQMLPYLGLDESTTWSNNYTLKTYSPMFDCPGWKASEDGKCYNFVSELTMPDGTKIKPWGTVTGPTGTTNPKPVKLIKIAELGLSTTWAVRDNDAAGIPSHENHRNALFFDMHVGRLDFDNNPL